MLIGIEKWNLFKESSAKNKKLIDDARLNTAAKVAMFLSQCHHESAGFTRTRENLNYSSDALLKIFPARFNKETAVRYGRTNDHKANEEMIGNIAYALRLGNGDIKSGDGYKYRGGGYIQITGRLKYQGYGDVLEIDLINYPDLVTFVNNAFATALLYWIDNKLSIVDDIPLLTRKINGPAMLGLKERQELFIKYLGELD